MRGTGGMVGQYALPDRSYGHKWVDIKWIGWDQRYSHSRANGYDGMVGGGNMGTRWKSLGEGVDWLLLGFFCLFSTPSGGRKSLPFFVDFCGTQAPKQWRKAQRLFFLWDSQWCSRLHLEAVAAHFGKTFTTFDGHWFLFPVESIFGCKKKVFCFFIKKFQHFEVFQFYKKRRSRVT